MLLKTLFFRQENRVSTQKTVSQCYLVRKCQSGSTDQGGLAAGPSPSTIHYTVFLCHCGEAGTLPGYHLVSLFLIVYYVCAQNSTPGGMLAQVLTSSHCKHLPMLAFISKDTCEQRRKDKAQIL